MDHRLTDERVNRTVPEGRRARYARCGRARAAPLFHFTWKIVTTHNRRRRRRRSPFGVRSSVHVMGKLRIDCCHSQEHGDYMSRARGSGPTRGRTDDGGGRTADHRRGPPRRPSVRPSAFNKSRYHNLISFSSPSPLLPPSLLTTKVYIDFTVILPRPISAVRRPRRRPAPVGWRWIQPAVRAAPA